MDDSKIEILNRAVEILRDKYNIPGVSLAVVINGDIAFTCGYGNKSFTSGSQCAQPSDNLQCPQPVTESTLFGIGSITKGFTSVLLASLLQNRKDINWDTPIKEIFKDVPIEFLDPFRTDQACLRDILAHKMGIELGETDFAFLFESFERSDIKRNLRHFLLAAGFRTKLMYNNLLYSVAGDVIELLTGSKWESIIQDSIFDLLGMDQSVFIDQAAPDFTNFARPHMAVKGEPREIDLNVHVSSLTCGPAASIASSAKDMAKWMIFLLNDGQIHGCPVIHKRFLEECWKPQFVLPDGKQEWSGYIHKPDFPHTETRESYGFGFYNGTYRGYKYHAHAGELLGFDSLLTLFPDKHVGIYTSLNGPGGEAAYITNQLLHYIIADLTHDLDLWLTDDLVTFPEPWVPRDKYFIPRCHVDFNKDRPIIDGIDMYIGMYKHELLGQIQIEKLRDNVLLMRIGPKALFHLYCTELTDEFRIEGQGIYSFLHQVDLYQPSSWMIVHFNRINERVESLICSLFESGPVFKRQEDIVQQ